MQESRKNNPPSPRLRGINKRILFFLLAIFLAGNLFLLAPREAEAQFGLPTPVWDIADPIKEVKQKAKEVTAWLLKRAASAVFKRSLKMITNRLAYETALYVTSGAPGQKSMFRTKGWEEQVRDLGKTAAGDFVQSMVTEFGTAAVNKGTAECSGLKSIKCSDDAQCWVKREGYVEGDERSKFGECKLDPEIICREEKDCNSGEDLDKISGDRAINWGPCMIGKTYAGPCEGASRFWTAVGTDLKNFNVCQPPSLNTTVAITLGVFAGGVGEPIKPECSWTEMRKNWEEAVKRSNFLPELSRNWNPEESEIGAYLRLSGEMAGFQSVQQDIQKHVDSVTGALKDKESPVSKYVQTPSIYLQMMTGKSIDEANAAEKTFTGDIVADAINTFFGTLASRLAKQYWEKGLVNYKPDDIAQIFTGGVSGRAQAKKQFAELVKPEIISDTNYDALTNFLACPDDERYANVDNCVLDNDFADAIRQRMTVGEALDEGLLNKAGDFGFGDYNNQNSTILNPEIGYAQHNIKKLRLARIVPAGWELAVERAIEVRNYATKELGKGDVAIYHKFNLKNIVDCFEDSATSTCKYKDIKVDASGVMKKSESCTTTDCHNPFWHLVDPDWVLKAPEQRCNARVFGSTMIESGQRPEICVDPKSCIVESGEGKCLGYYDYCTREKNIWRFKGTACEAKYDTCEAFKNVETGADNYYLQSTLDIASCDQGNAGCSWYCLDYNLDAVSDVEGKIGNWACYWDGAKYISTAVPHLKSDSPLDAVPQRIYLNKKSRVCSGAGEGCTEFIILNPGVNLARNGSFGNDYDNDTLTADGWIGEIEIEDGGAKMVATKSASQSLNLEPETYYVIGVKVKKLAEAEGLMAWVKIDGGSEPQAENFVIPEGYDDTPGNTWVVPYDGGKSIGLELSGAVDLKTDYSSFFGVIKSNFGLDNGTISFGCVAGACVFDNLQVTEVSFAEADAGITSAPEYKDYGLNTKAYFKRAPEKYRCEDDAVLAYEDKETCERGVGKWNGFCHWASGEDSTDFEKWCKDNSANGYVWDDSSDVCAGVPSRAECIDEDVGGAMTLEAGDGCAHLDECKSFATTCKKDDVGCQLYTDKKDSIIQIPGVVTDEDYCPSECDGYQYFRQMETYYESAKDQVPAFAPQSGASAGKPPITCSGYVGCTEFTNLEDVASGGEKKEYFSYLWQCVKPSESGEACKTFYTWVGDDTQGYELKTFELKADAGGSPALTSTESAGLCMKEKVGLLSPPNDKKECKEFQDTEGKSYYVIYQDTILCTENCAQYRITDVDIANEHKDSTNCTNNYGNWDIALEKCFYCSRFGGDYDGDEAGETGHRCIYQGAPEFSQACPAQYGGCRAYKGNRANAIRNVFDGVDDFEPGVNDDWSGGGVSTEASEIGGHSLKVDGTASKDVSQVDNGCYDGSITTSEKCTAIGGVWNLKQVKVAEVEKDTCNNVTQSDCGVESGTWVDFANFPVKKDQSYIVSFWAKTSDAGDGSSDVKLGFKTQLNPTAYLNFGEIQINTEWRPYRLGPVYFNREVENDEVLEIIASGGGFYIDNIILSGVTETEALIKNSWTIPESCDLPFKEAQINCSAYTDKVSNTSSVNLGFKTQVNIHYLKSFTSICGKDAIGCSALIDTKNSDNPFVEEYKAICKRDDGGSGVCKIDGEEKCTIEAEKTECEFINYRVLEDSWTYLVADKSKTCKSEEQGCTRMAKANYGGTEYIDSYSEIIKKIDPDEFSSSLCGPLYDRCVEYNNGSIVFKDPKDKVCQWVKPKTGEPEGWYYDVKGDQTEFKACNDPDPSDPDETPASGAEPEVFRLNNADKLAYPAGGFAKTCMSQAAGCTHFIDPADGTDDQAKRYYQINNSIDSARGKCTGGIDAKKGCVGFRDDRRNPDGSYKAVLNVLAGSGYKNATPFAPKACIPSDCYVDGDPATEQIKENLLTDNKCLNDGRSPCNANEILEVDNDRVCAEWLACRSGGVVTDNKGKDKPICYNVGLCSEAEPDQPSKCKKWVEPTGTEQPLTASVYQSRDTGWGGQEFSGYSIANTYPLASLKQMSWNGSGDSDSYRLVYDSGVNSPWKQEKPCEKNSDCNGNNKDCSKKTCYMKCEQGQCVASKICRGYPAVDSPFPYMTKNDQDETTNYCAKDYKSETTPDCDCGYQKVTYKESQDQYYNYNDTEIEPCGAKLGEPPQGNRERKCGKCDNNQNVCDDDSDCTNYDTDPATKGKCQFNDTVEKRQKFLGWRGYCVEWDEKTDSCLTWYPTDYLTGDADMYNNFQGAGYNPGEDKYYCLEANNGGSEYPILTLIADKCEDKDDCKGMCKYYDKADGLIGCADGISIDNKAAPTLARETMFNEFDIEYIKWTVKNKTGDGNWPVLGDEIITNRENGWYYQYLNGNTFNIKTNFDSVTHQLKSYTAFINHTAKDYGGIWLIGSIYLRGGSCLTIAQTVSMDKNIALTDRLWEKSGYIVSKDKFIDIVGTPLENGYAYGQDYSPFGSAVTPYNSPDTWDSIPGEEGNQPLYVEAPNNNQVRAGSPYACSASGGCNGKRVCVGGKNAGMDCTVQGVKQCQGGVCVGSDKAVNNKTISEAIASIEEIFAKSMGVWKYKTAGICSDYDRTGVVKNPNPGISCTEDEQCNFKKAYTCNATALTCIGGGSGTSCDWDGCSVGNCCGTEKCEKSASCTGGAGICKGTCFDGPKSGEFCVSDSDCEYDYQGVCSLINTKYSDKDLPEPSSWDVTWDLAGTNTTKIATKPPEISGMTVDLVKGTASLPVKLNFFASADDNHMPIKKIRIDWGDKEKLTVGSEQSYYKNHKAECTARCDAPGAGRDGWVCPAVDEDSCLITCDLDESPVKGIGTVCGSEGKTGQDCYIGEYYVCCVEEGKTFCERDYALPKYVNKCRKQFGDTNEACVAEPFEFSHVYYCSDSVLINLPDCTFDKDGLITNSPCKSDGKCNYRPKAQVVDNWGWCNGRCAGVCNDPAGKPCAKNEQCNTGGTCDLSGSRAGCYEGDIEKDPNALQECSNEPFETGDYPYVDYGNRVIVNP